MIFRVQKRSGTDVLLYNLTVLPIIGLLLKVVPVPFFSQRQCHDVGPEPFVLHVFLVQLTDVAPDKFVRTLGNIARHFH